MTNNVNLSKVVTYAVTQKDDSINLSKYVNYGVSQITAARLSKTVQYTTTQIPYGALYQDDASKKPVYREAPTGSISYVDMSAANAELKVYLPFTDTYTFIIYNADETFTVLEEELDQGENVAPITEDFNQCVIIRGPIHRFARESIKEGMKARAS